MEVHSDGQVLFQTKGKRWIIRGVTMSNAQMKRQSEQQISDKEKRKQANQKS